jgi:hypothetical protein
MMNYLLLFFESDLLVLLLRYSNTKQGYKIMLYCCLLSSEGRKEKKRKEKKRSRIEMSMQIVDQAAMFG